MSLATPARTPPPAPLDDVPADAAGAPATPGALPELRDGPDALLAQGDYRGAIAALIDAHGDDVFALCARILRDRTLAEDVAQQVFLEAYRDIAGFRRRSSLKTWLLKIAGHRCQDAIRSQIRRRRVIEVDAPATADQIDPRAAPTEQVERSLLLAAVDECLQGLSEEVRMTVLLRFQHAMSYEEMALDLGVRADALHARVARALPVLRRCLESKGWRDG
jgi:RNA polymerase sigma-70 factor (ECF subfamily)